MSIICEKVAGFLEWIDKIGDPRMKELWLMDSPWPILIILIGYLYFVLKAGPEFMKSRGPLNIDRIVMVYNITQISLSFYMVKKAFQLVWLQDNYRFNCIEIDYSDTDEARDKVFITWLYMFSKVLDLLDTIFFVLRKKQNQLTFLHIYHHAMVLSFSWCILRHYPGGQIAFFGTINAFVHFIMYTYYFLTILNPAYKKAWWKKYLTQLQMIQFVLVIVQGILGLLSTDCNFPKYVTAFTIPQDILMFILFWKFYKTAYAQPKNKLT